MASSSRLIVPPRTTATALGTAYRIGFKDADRNEIAAIDESIMAARSEENGIDIEQRLAKINPHYAAKWRGCWIALGSNNPDKVSQAAYSGREMLAQVLHALAPDELFSPEELERHGRKGKNATRKMRIAKILGAKTDSSTVEVVESLARTIDSVYNALSAIVHDYTGTVLEVVLVGYLVALKGSLILLFGYLDI